MPASEFLVRPPTLAWRLPLRWRLLLIAVQAVLPALGTGVFWMAVDWTPANGDQYLAAPWNWLVLAGSVLAWLALAGRAWRESVTLAPDLLVVRDVFRTRRIALADVTGVSFGRAGMVAVRTAGAALPGGGGLGTHASGRRAGRAVTIGAAKMGGAYWSGRRTSADAVAEAIAAAAGLPPLRPRRQLIGRRQALVMIPAGMALFALAAAIGQPGTGPVGLAAFARLAAFATLGPASLVLVIPAGLAALDLTCARWRGNQAGAEITGLPGGPESPGGFSPYS